MQSSVSRTAFNRMRMSDYLDLPRRPDRCRWRPPQQMPPRSPDIGLTTVASISLPTLEFAVGLRSELQLRQVIARGPGLHGCLGLTHSGHGPPTGTPWPGAGTPRPGGSLRSSVLPSSCRALSHPASARRIPMPAGSMPRGLSSLPPASAPTPQPRPSQQRCCEPRRARRRKRGGTPPAPSSGTGTHRETSRRRW